MVERNFLIFGFESLFFPAIASALNLHEKILTNHRIKSLILTNQTHLYVKLKFVKPDYPMAGPQTTEVAKRAAINGHSQILACLHANDRIGKLCLSVMDNAAVNGHFEVVQWLSNSR